MQNNVNPFNGTKYYVIKPTLGWPFSRQQTSWGQHGAHLDPVGPRWAPCRMLSGLLSYGKFQPNGAHATHKRMAIMISRSYDGSTISETIHCKYSLIARFMDPVGPRWAPCRMLSGLLSYGKFQPNGAHAAHKRTAIMINRSYDESTISETIHCQYSLIGRFMGPTWGPSGANKTQMGPLLAPWTLLSVCCSVYSDDSVKRA